MMKEEERSGRAKDEFMGSLCFDSYFGKSYLILLGRIIETISRGRPFPCDTPLLLAHEHHAEDCYFPSGAYQHSTRGRRN